MKKFNIALMMGLMLTMLFSTNAFSKAVSNDTDNNWFYSNIPQLNEKMLSPSYWIKSGNMSKVIMSKEQIEEYNKKSINEVDVIVDIQNYKKTFTKEELTELIKGISTPSKYERYHEDGKLVTEQYYNKLIDNCNIAALKDSNDIKYGITVRRTDMRTFPTYDRIFKSGDNYEFDRFQETAVYPVEPLVILHTSKDGEWYFAQMYNYLAWIPKQDVAVVNKEELFNYINSDNFIVTTGKGVFTNYNPLDEQLSEIKLDMGVRIPLANKKEISEEIYGQNPTGNYVVKLPTRNEKGSVKFKYALIPMNEDVSVGYLPYTRENIIVQAFKFLGERYGWGGMFNSRDCTGFLMDAYRTMGIRLPRNSGEQGNLAVGQFYEMPEEMTIADREKLLDTLVPGTPVYMSGHAMLYIGKYNGEHYIIHDFSGFYTPQKDGNLKYNKSREVMVTPLSIGLSDEGQTYIEGLYGGRDFILVK